MSRTFRGGCGHEATRAARASAIGAASGVNASAKVTHTGLSGATSASSTAPPSSKIEKRAIQKANKLHVERTPVKPGGQCRPEAKLPPLARERIRVGDVNRNDRRAGSQKQNSPSLPYRNSLEGSQRDSAGGSHMFVSLT
jgi:hypothetical protein